MTFVVVCCVFFFLRQQLPSAAGAILALTPTTPCALRLVNRTADPVLRENLRNSTVATDGLSAPVTIGAMVVRVMNMCYQGGGARVAAVERRRLNHAPLHIVVVGATAVNEEVY